MSLPVGFVYTDTFNQYDFGEGHPLTPKRIELTYSLMKAYHLLEHPLVKLLQPRIATEEEVLRIHEKPYILKLQELNGIDRPSYKAYPEFGLGPGDNPIFPHMYDAALAVCGASLTAAEYIMQEDCSRVFNITGGLHHAMPGMASGFCLLNDIAVAIQYILDHSPPNTRIMYLDLDCHHGDGVQWIFYDRPNVLTLSFHQDGRTIFPGTGFIEENGKGLGKGFHLNVPFLPGTIDNIYLDTYERIVPKVMKIYRPDYLVMQLGVDTHFTDPITVGGLSTEGQEKIFKTTLEYIPKYCKNKLMALGGGGYNIGVVARSWSMYLAAMIDASIRDPLPAEWLTELHQKWTDSPPPTQLRDRNYFIEERQIKDPMWIDELQAHMDSIVKIYDRELLPGLQSAMSS